MGKLICLAFFASAVALALANLSLSHNLKSDEGVHDLEDCPYPVNATFALCNTEVHQNGRWFTTLVKDVTCPSTGVNTDPIMCIRAINLEGDSKGGYAKILSGGGVGFYSTTVRLTSQYGKGLNFRVEVYTHKNLTTGTQ